MDVGLLVLGVVAGLVLGPWVFGSFWEQGYRNVFVGDSGAQAKIASIEADYADRIERTRETGVSPAGVSDIEQERDAAIREVESTGAAQRTEHAAWLNARRDSLVLAIGIVLLLAAAIGPRRPLMQARLVTACYALLAGWIAITLARPAGMGSLPWVFVGLLTAVAVIVALLPVGRAVKH